MRYTENIKSQLSEEINSHLYDYKEIQKMEQRRKNRENYLFFTDSDVE
jgi:hypothetical protein